MQSQLILVSQSSSDSTGFQKDRRDEKMEVVLGHCVAEELVAEEGTLHFSWCDQMN